MNSLTNMRYIQALTITHSNMISTSVWIRNTKVGYVRSHMVCCPSIWMPWWRWIRLMGEPRSIGWRVSKRIKPSVVGLRVSGILARWRLKLISTPTPICCVVSVTAYLARSSGSLILVKGPIERWWFGSSWIRCWVIAELLYGWLISNIS